VRDLVEAYEGSLKLTTSKLGGLQVEIDLPAAG
jgi:C4-dicarboxylate-specific signal transduction histidine kinase